MELHAQMHDVGQARGQHEGLQDSNSSRASRKFGVQLWYAACLSVPAVQANLRQALRSRGEVPQGHVPAFKLV